MTIFIWDPGANTGSGSGWSKGSAKHISTQGFKPTNHPITLATQGFIIFETSDINLLTGGVADTSATLGGQVAFEYEPEGGVVTGGEGTYVLDDAGILIYDYESTGSEIDGGLILAGEAEITFIRNGIGFKEHGGRGVLPWKRKHLGPTHTYIWHAPLLRRFAIKVKGAATTGFKSGERYPFLKTLPAVMPPVAKEEPDLFKALNAYTKQAALPAQYDAVGFTNPKYISGRAIVTFSPANQRAFSDDELALLLSDEDDPIILSMSFDS